VRTTTCRTSATAGKIVASIGPLMDYDAFQPYGPNYTVPA
jgi:hypothetical protein